MSPVGLLNATRGSVSRVLGLRRLTLMLGCSTVTRTARLRCSHPWRCLVTATPASVVQTAALLAAAPLSARRGCALRMLRVRFLYGLQLLALVALVNALLRESSQEEEGGGRKEGRGPVGWL